MKETIDVYEILKQCATEGMKLWSPVVGDCTFKGLRTDVIKRIIAKFIDRNGNECEWSFRSNGFTASVAEASSAEVVLFPSREMRDWEKFAWKKGDVLATKNKTLTVVFERFNNTYESFVAKYSFCSYQEQNEDDAWNKEGANSYKTPCFSKVSKKEAEEFIKKIEEHYGGKFSLSTLEIENVQKPNEGDVMYLPEIENKTYPVIFIFKEIADGNIYDHASLVFENRYSPRLCVDGQNVAWESDKEYMRPATEEEKQQLFDELEKVGKRWNPDIKQIEDLKKEYEFKPFDRVLVRDEPEDCWQANLFSCTNRNMVYPFICVSEKWKQCIPYNEKTRHLLGTNDDYEEGDEL